VDPEGLCDGSAVRVEELVDVDAGELVEDADGDAGADEVAVADAVTLENADGEPLALAEADTDGRGEIVPEGLVDVV